MLVPFAAILLSFCFLAGRLAMLCTNKEYARTAEEQCEVEITLGSSRGNIFDCNFVPLTNTETVRYALSQPGKAAYYTLFADVAETEKEQLYRQTQALRPFLLRLQSTENAPYVFTTTQRYASSMTACHLVGYLNSDGNGISGAEYAFNDILQGGAAQQSIRCGVTPLGTFIEGKEPYAVFEQGNGNGVMLTIDSTLQHICEGAAADMARGCIVVMDTKSGCIRALVSKPTFDANNIAASIQKADTSLMNRAVSSYNVGSVFKVAVAATALQNGILPTEKYVCTGSITVDGQTYHCAGHTAHGEIDMTGAIANSCNCYFIQMGLRLGGAALLAEAAQLGFGESLPYLGNVLAAGGSLPTIAQLQNMGELASFSFGQGKLLATPLQIAAYMNTFANGGVYISPSLVQGIVNENTHTVVKSLYAPITRRVLSPEKAMVLRLMLISAAEEGIAQGARPENATVGGKTGTAQTGRFDDNGEEELDAWFAGFTPAETPQYTIVVMLDSGRSTSAEACAIFKSVVSSMSFFA